MNFTQLVYLPSAFFVVGRVAIIFSPMNVNIYFYRADRAMRMLVSSKSPPNIASLLRREYTYQSAVWHVLRKKMVTRACFVTVLTIYEQASGQMNTLGWSCSGNTNQYICLLMWFGRNSNNSNNNKRKNKRKRIIIKNTSDVLCLFSYFN